MPTIRLMCPRYLKDSIRYSVGEDSSFRRAALSKGCIYIMIRGQLSINQEGKYTCTRNFFLPTLSQATVHTRLLETTRCYQIPSIPWTPLISLDYIVGYHLHLVRRSIVESVVYCTTSSSSSCSIRQQSERFRQGKEAASRGGGEEELEGRT